MFITSYPLRNSMLNRRSVPFALFALALVLSVGLGRDASAQILDEMSSGSEYVLVFPDTTTNQRDPRGEDMRFRDQFLVAIYSAVENEVDIVGASSSRRGIRLVAGQMTVIDLNDESAPMSDIVADAPGESRKTFYLRTEKPVVVYCMMITHFGGEAWTPLPVESWGQEYFAAALPGETVKHVDVMAPGPTATRRTAAPAEVVIVTNYEDTHIDIEPVGAFVGSVPAAGITMGARRAYLLQSRVDTSLSPGSQPDIAGVRIRANKPIGVLSGNTRSSGFIGEAPFSALTGNTFRGMLLEWLAPVEQHGRELAYLPTLDSWTPRGVPGENPLEKRRAEFVRLYGTGQDTANVERWSFSDTVAIASLGASAVLTDSIPRSGVVFYRANNPVQGFMHSTAVAVTAHPTITPPRYLTVAPYMLEMVPREQWTSFAPYFALPGPLRWESSVAVIADRASINSIQTSDGLLFPLFSQSPGGDLVWGTMPLNAGASGAIIGLDGARFYAVTYGTLEGTEWGAIGGGADYEEMMSIAYGFPLAPRRAILRPADTIEQTTSLDCSQLRVDLRIVNSSPAGIRNITLGSAVNAEIASIIPASYSGATSVTVVVRARDSLTDASAVLLILDRTGDRTQVPVQILARPIISQPSVVDFGAATAGANVIDSASLINADVFTHTIDSIRFSAGDRGFTLSAQTLPVVIEPAAAITITLQSTAASSEPTADTLLVYSGCRIQRIPLLRNVPACLAAEGLDFGIIAPEQERTKVMRLSNAGGEVLRFNAPTPISWDEPAFFVSADDQARLGSAVLRAGEEILIPIRFSSPVSGVFSTWAHFDVEGQACSDSALWRGAVSGSGAVDEGGETATAAIQAVSPNPVRRVGVVTWSTAARENVVLTLHDALGREVTSVARGAVAPGEYRSAFLVSGLTPGVYYLRLSSRAGVTAQKIVVQPDAH